MTIGPPEVISNVYPSAACFDAYSLPMLPPAPPRLSMMKVLPRASLRPLAVGRATMSDGPPGGQGTTIVTFLVGQDWAAAAEQSTRPSTPNQPLAPRNTVIANSSMSATNAPNTHVAGPADPRGRSRISILEHRGRGEFRSTATGSGIGVSGTDHEYSATRPSRRLPSDARPVESRTLQHAPDRRCLAGPASHSWTRRPVSSSADLPKGASTRESPRPGAGGITLRPAARRPSSRPALGSRRRTGSRG